MKFYEFSQSNPGGSYDESMPSTFYIQADSCESADAIAEQHGVYFDGVAAGIDCECCNDRWYRSWASNATVNPPEPPSNDIIIIYASKLFKELS
jgi:hypothetical protein